MTEPIKRTSGAQKFGLEAAGVVTSRVSVRLFQFISTLLLARLLGPSGRGLVSALTVPAQLAISISEMGIRQSTAFHLGRKIYPLERLMPTLLTTIPIASSLAIALALTYFEIAGVAEGNWTLRILSVLSIPFWLTSSYASGVFLGRQRIAEFRKTSWRPALVSLILVIILTWGLKLGVAGAIIANAIGASAAFGYALYLLAKEMPLRLGFDPTVAASLQRRGFSYAAAMIVMLVNYRVMILLLARIGTMAEVGLYAQATAIAELIWEIPTMLGALLLSRGVNAKDPLAFSRKVLALTRFSFVAAILLSLFLAAAAEYVFPLLYGRRFAESGPICVMLLPGIVAFIVFKVLNTDLGGRGKPWASMIIMVPVFVINLVVGWLLINRYGVMGAAAADSICYVGATIAYVWLYARLVGVSYREILLPQPGDLELLRRALPTSITERLSWLRARLRMG